MVTLYVYMYGESLYLVGFGSHVLRVGTSGRSERLGYDHGGAVAIGHQLVGEFLGSDRTEWRSAGGRG